MTKLIDITAIMNPKQLYLTPGLWERTGESFWNALLFETPFAIMRGFFWMIYPCMIILYVIFAIKANIYYRKTKFENKI